jgi:hypothetical protein
VVTGAESGNFRVDKMRFPDKNDKSVIEFNPWIRISKIPLAAYEYVVNGRSAIEWIIDRYQVRVDKDSGIKNDPNDWGLEHRNPRYILDLLLSVITVSMETMKIVKALPALDNLTGRAEQAAAAVAVEPESEETEIDLDQDYPATPHEFAVDAVMAHIIKTVPGIRQDKAFQYAWAGTLPEVCAALLGDKGDDYKAAYAQSGLAQWQSHENDAVRLSSILNSYEINYNMHINGKLECSISDDIDDIQGIDKVIPYILEAGRNYDLGIDALMKKKGFTASLRNSLQHSFSVINEGVQIASAA